MFDILVLNYNDARTTIDFVESVKEFTSVRKILVVDNHSSDGSLDLLKKIETEKIIVVDSGMNRGYGAGNNFGIRYLNEHYGSEYILLSNPDVIVKEKDLVELESFLRNNSTYAIVAPFMLDCEGKKLYSTAFRIPSKWESILSIHFLLRKLTNSIYYKNIESETQRVKDVGAVAGSMLMMRTKDMLEYGMYDENIFLYCEELILGMKMQKACKKTAVLTDCSYIHNHSVTISKMYKTRVSKRRLYTNSTLYTLKHYYRANLLELTFARLLAKWSMFELWCDEILKMFKLCCRNICKQ